MDLYDHFDPGACLLDDEPESRVISRGEVDPAETDGVEGVGIGVAVPGRDRPPFGIRTGVGNPEEEKAAGRLHRRRSRPRKHEEFEVALTADDAGAAHRRNDVRRGADQALVGGEVVDGDGG